MLKFKKMHGLGNDFIIIDGREYDVRDPARLSAMMCNRHTGIGADGLLVVTSSRRADIGMRIFNSDGSQAEMCGNGIRCFARYVFEEGILDSLIFTVDTLAGIVKPRLVADECGGIEGVIVDMGKPVLDPGGIPVAAEGGSFLEVPVRIGTEGYTLSTIGMGVPHTVVYVEDLDSTDIELEGRGIEGLPMFPDKTNVNFVQVVDRNNIRVRTWERGAGATLACGTGCCSAVVISSLLDKTDREVQVGLALGRLKIIWAEDGNVFMEGPAANICSGVWAGD